MLHCASGARRALRGLSGTRSHPLGTTADEAEEEPQITRAELRGPAERRMQLRAFDLWMEAHYKKQRSAPAELRLNEHPDLAAHAAQFDITEGSEDPRLAFLGDQLAAECGIARESVARVSDLPGHSLLRRVAEQYLSVMADQTPIGFEAQWSGANSETVLYRGILLPFSCEVRKASYVYSVINWKTLSGVADEGDLLLGLDQVIEAPQPRRSESAMVAA
jgi:hypothetical protein